MTLEDSKPLRPFDPQAAAISVTHRALFGRLRTEDAATSIARRLRTAIGLGLLNDGDRLPKEADLAAQLDVTAFSLREALSVLRSEGLITTKAGAKGGSFVRAVETTLSMAADDLSKISATQLRDLGDWHATLLMSAARLAARRRAGAHDVRLGGLVTELRQSSSADQARRILGSFHVELAAAAQSMRLTRAELTAHEEFGWLMQAVLADSSVRKDLATSMSEVVEAVNTGDTEAAWHSAERMTDRERTDLTRKRLRLVADQDSATTSSAESDREHEHGTVGGLRATLLQLIDAVVNLLQSVADDIAISATSEPTRASLTPQVARAVLGRLAEVDDIVLGLGFMVAPGILPDSEHWIEWWERSADGTFDRDTGHQLDPAADNFYDYGAQDYFVLPRQTHEPHAMGPYIDHGGVDDYMVTFAVPVLRDGNFLGIAGADVRVSDIERAAASWLALDETPHLLVNAESRVLLSTSAKHDIGDVLSNENGAGTSTAVGQFGWRIVKLKE